MGNPCIPHGIHVFLMEFHEFPMGYSWVISIRELNRTHLWQAKASKWLTAFWSTVWRLTHFDVRSGQGSEFGTIQRPEWPRISSGQALKNRDCPQGRIKNKLGLMLMTGKGPIFFLAFKTDQEVQDPSFWRNYPLLNAVTYIIRLYRHE